MKPRNDKKQGPQRAQDYRCGNTVGVEKYQGGNPNKKEYEQGHELFLSKFYAGKTKDAQNKGKKTAHVEYFANEIIDNAWQGQDAGPKDESDSV